MLSYNLFLGGISGNNHEQFVLNNWAYAVAAYSKYGVHPILSLAQSVNETNDRGVWGGSYSAKNRNNYFGFTAYGSTNEYWTGAKSQSSASGLPFRVYNSPSLSFLDYARLISSKYSGALKAKTIEEFADFISKSAYISEVNGDNRQAYKNGIIKNAQEIIQIAIKNNLINGSTVSNTGRPPDNTSSGINIFPDILGLGKYNDMIMTVMVIAGVAVTFNILTSAIKYNP